jgi:mRNA-degrading endonuclease YafQ of YafQ-DinJ toxin-antitoxin module
MARIERVAWAPSFKRAFRKRVLGSPVEKVFRERLEMFIKDPFAPGLKTHKLTGALSGLWAFSVGYDCRVVVDIISPKEVILVDIGPHDDVY